MPTDVEVREWLATNGLVCSTVSDYERWLYAGGRLPLGPQLSLAAHVDANGVKSLDKAADRRVVDLSLRHRQSVGRHLQLVNFPHRDAGKRISGMLILALAIRRNCHAGWLAANWMIKHCDRIPRRWQKYQLVFAGTLTNEIGGFSFSRPQVVIAEFECDKWSVFCRDLSVELSDRARLVRLR